MIRVKEMSKKIVADLNGRLGSIGSGEFIPLPEKKAEKIAADPHGWVEYPSLKDYYNYRNQKRDERRKYNDRMITIAKDPESFSAVEIWESAVWHTKYMGGRLGADMLIRDNPLSRILKKKLLSYKVVPFSDGTLLVKTEGGELYGTKRGWKEIETLIK